MSIENWIKLKLQQYRFLQAKRLADNLHKTDGKRYFVMPRGRYYDVINCAGINRINRRNPKHLRISFPELMKNAAYRTK